MEQNHSPERSIADILSEQRVPPLPEETPSPLSVAFPIEGTSASAAPALPEDAPATAGVLPRAPLPRKKTLLLAAGGGVVVLLLVLAAVFLPSSQEIPPPPMDGLYWGMSLEEAKRVLNPLPENIVYGETGQEETSLYIEGQTFSTLYGTTSEVILYFLEDESGNAVGGLDGIYLILNQPIEEVASALASNYSLTPSSAGRPDDFSLQSKTTLQACLPGQQRDGFLRYLANPKYDYKWLWTELPYHEKIIPQKAAGYFDGLPVIDGRLYRIEYIETTYLYLSARLPAELYYYDNNQAAASTLDWNSFFHYVPHGLGPIGSYAFYGIRLQGGSPPEQRETFACNLSFLDVSLPAERMTLEYTSDTKDALYSGSLEWLVPDAERRRDLTEEITQALVFTLGPEKEREQPLTAGILHQWDDPFGNHIYLQEDAAAGVVRVTARAD